MTVYERIKNMTKEELARWFEANCICYTDTPSDLIEYGKRVEDWLNKLDTEET